MEQQKKKRGENWSSEDKDILRQLVGESAKILEDKSTKTNVNNSKTKEWRNITNKLNEITGKDRTDSEIKLAWKRMKLAAKANLSQHRREQLQTGGGNKPPSPSPEDLAVMAIAPLDFIIEANDYDSDATIAHSSTIIVEDRNAGQAMSSIEEPLIESESSIQINPVTHYASEALDSQVADNGPNMQKRGNNRKEDGRQAIINSNLHFKRKQMAMMEVEHSNKVEIQKFKLRKLQLEIALLEQQTKINTSAKE